MEAISNGRKATLEGWLVVGMPSASTRRVIPRRDRYRDRESYMNYVDPLLTPLDRQSDAGDAFTHGLWVLCAVWNLRGNRAT